MQAHTIRFQENLWSYMQMYMTFPRLTNFNDPQKIIHWEDKKQTDLLFIYIYMQNVSPTCPSSTHTLWPIKDRTLSDPNVTLKSGKATQTAETLNGHYNIKSCKDYVLTATPIVHP